MKPDATSAFAGEQISVTSARPRGRPEEEAGLADSNCRLAATFFRRPIPATNSCTSPRATRGPNAFRRRIEEIELVRVPVAELESCLGEIEDTKTLAGLLVYVRER